MIDIIYIEEQVMDHERTKEILSRFPKADPVYCDHYGEIFNRRAQNFRIQKKNPALILAKRHEHHVLPTPEGYGIGGHHNYYFSHVLNCLYDCRYCFLQGMYQSAHYVMFVNYEDFLEEIRSTCLANPHEDYYFFSGYDCDSLALDAVTKFTDSFLPAFREIPNAWLELRTKSLVGRRLLDIDPDPQTVVAFSLTPEAVSRKLEKGVPPLDQRIKVMKELANAGWKVGFRLDPLISHESFEANYSELIEILKEQIPQSQIHSVSIGPLRFPKQMFQDISRLYPEEPLFACGMQKRDSMVSYGKEREQKMIGFVEKKMLEFIEPEKLFSCLPESF